MSTAAADAHDADARETDTRDTDTDVVVIGSGFGGSVAALRLAEKGYRVVVLEAGRRFADLNLLALELSGPGLSAASGLPDEAFAHDGQLTKAEVRAVTLCALAPRDGGLLWDSGAGAGGVAI